MPMQVGGGARKQRLQCELEILLRARTRLEDRDTGCRVRDEHLQEPITSLTAEPRRKISDVGGETATRGQLDEEGIHEPTVPCALRLRGDILPECRDDALPVLQESALLVIVLQVDRELVDAERL